MCHFFLLARVRCKYSLGSNAPSSRLRGSFALYWLRGPADVWNCAIASPGFCSVMSQMLPKPKDQIDKEETRDPVYDIPCADCRKSYIGETQRKFLTRKREHQKAVARRQGEKSALADHVIKTNHDIAWDEATILKTNSN